MRAPILMYHHVLPPAEEATASSPLFRDSYLPLAELQRQLDTLMAAGVRTVTVSELLEPREERAPGRRVALTFDDGCTCFLDGVLPELVQRKMTATLYAVSGELGGTNRWDRPAGERPERLLDEEGLRCVARAGIEVGCHSGTHPDLTTCSDDDLRHETAGARRSLEKTLDRPVRTFCYPYGILDPRVRAAVRDAGYAGAVSIHGKVGAMPRDPFALPRLPVRPGEGRFELWLKFRGLYPLWSRLPRLGLLARLRGGGEED